MIIANLNFKLDTELFSECVVSVLFIYREGKLAGTVAFTSHSSEQILEVVQIEVIEEFQDKGICQLIYQQLRKDILLGGYHCDKFKRLCT